MDSILVRLSQFGDPTVKNLLQLVDILLVAMLIFKILTMVRGSRAWRIVGGAAVFVAALLLSEWMGLKTLHWILDRATVLAPVALVIFLLPELRQALEGAAKLGLWPERFGFAEEKAEAKTVEEIVAAMSELAQTQTGALVVIEIGTMLDDIVSNGVNLHAQVTAPLLCSIFYGENPLHDGAAIIRGDTVLAAACRLPLSESREIDSHYHMRHRAAVGMSEQASCLVIVVSEERGTISVAEDGEIVRMESPLELRDLLNRRLRGVGKDGSIKPKSLLRFADRERSKSKPKEQPEEDKANVGS